MCFPNFLFLWIRRILFWQASQRKYDEKVKKLLLNSQRFKTLIFLEKTVSLKYCSEHVKCSFDNFFKKKVHHKPKSFCTISTINRKKNQNTGFCQTRHLDNYIAVLTTLQNSFHRTAERLPLNQCPKTIKSRNFLKNCSTSKCYYGEKECGLFATRPARFHQ